MNHHEKKYLIKKLVLLLLVIFTTGWMHTSFAQDGEGGWTQLPDMPTARGKAGIAFLDGKFYAIGGWHLPETAYGCNEVFDTTLNDWDVRANALESLAGHSISSTNGKIYSIGNYESAAVQEYDPIEDSWIYKNDLPEIRYNHNSCVLNDTIYITGGAGTNSAGRSIMRYDPIADTSIHLSYMNNSRLFHSNCVYNNKIYVFGGFGDFPNLLKSTEVYDPQQNTWQELSDMLVAFSSSVAVSYKDKILLFGVDIGPGEINPTDNVYQYDPETDIWTRMEDMPFKRSYMSGFKTGKYLYIFGGFTGPSRETQTNEVWKFNLDSLKEWVDPLSIELNRDINSVFNLHTVYPNPFSGFTQISYELTSPGRVQLEIYNCLGKRIAVLANQRQDPGEYDVTWNAEGVTPGIYFCRLRLNGYVQTRKLIVSPKV